MSQPPPTPGREPVTEQVIADLRERREKGIETYGRPLTCFNGRNALLDAYEEALDLAQYLKQAQMERELLVAVVKAAQAYFAADDPVEMDSAWNRLVTAIEALEGVDLS